MAQLSAAGVRFIASFEGFSETCYDDGGPGRGNCTIGYGHLVHYGRTTIEDRLRWGRITRGSGLAMLKKDAYGASVAVQRLGVKLTQPQTDALISFAFNCGVGALNGSVGRAVKSKPRLPWPLNILALKKWHGRVRAALLLWDHAGGQMVPGLKRRRTAEADLFSTGRYTSN